MPNTPDRIKFLSLAAAALLISGVPAAAADFPSIVRAILDSQTDGPLAEMDADKRGRMTDCVIDTLGALPDGLKRKIVEGKDLEEQEHLFGEVVDENHAKWRQTIAKACGQIATAAE
jgi:hypothetical protein